MEIGPSSAEEEEEMVMRKSNYMHNPSSSSSSSTTSSHHYHQYRHPPHHHDHQVNSNRHRQQQLLPPPPPASLEEEAEDQEEVEVAIRDDNDGSGDVMVIEKEHMFDKVVTPSDVGKLNRLVIPKQHAEKHFPLDSSTHDKGLLLNFEDRNGKPWRFRYSYWNSSQSYVMTKGWSRFVKEKKLDAGDIVSFQRGVGELARDKLFIDWRRRPDHPHPASATPPSSSSFYHYQYLSTTPNNPTLLMPPPPPILPRDTRLYWPNPTRNTYYDTPQLGGGGGYGRAYACVTATPNTAAGTVIYMRPAAPAAPLWQQQGGFGFGGGGGGVVVNGASSVMDPRVYDSVPVVQGKASAAKKRLRLFGVNVDCPVTNASNSDAQDRSSNVTTSATSIGGGTISFPAAHQEAGVPAPPNSHQYHYPSQLTLYNGTQASTAPASPTNFPLNKGKSSSSSMSLDLELSDDS